jgi:hypothetical protein
MEILNVFPLRKNCESLSSNKSLMINFYFYMLNFMKVKEESLC